LLPVGSQPTQALAAAQVVQVKAGYSALWGQRKQVLGQGRAQQKQQKDQRANHSLHGTRPHLENALFLP